MKRTQIQLPDHLYIAAHRLAESQELSMAELVRRGLEYMLAIVPGKTTPGEWQLPPAHNLESSDPFVQVNWRSNLHMRDLKVAEQPAVYGKTKP